MKILAVDASGQVASVAIISDNRILAEYSVDYQKTHSQTLLPMIDEVLQMTETGRETLDVIAVSEGPGSFTGLRIGIATVKGLAAALQIPVVGIPTLEMLAANFMGNQELICPMMDARRNQVYTGIYGFCKDQLQTVLPQRVCAVEEIITELNAMGQEVILLGDGADAYCEQLKQQLTCPHRFAPAHRNRQRAGSLAILAQRKAENHETQNGAELVPEYLRLSQAERERKEREEKRSVGTL